MIELKEHIKRELKQADRLYAEACQRFPNATVDQRLQIAQLAQTLGYTIEEMHDLVTDLQGAVS
ncbi:MAG: hypothetical protein WKF63_08615 [Thermomicrobiales bacterium]